MGQSIAAFFTTDRPPRGMAIALTAVVGVFGVLFVTLASILLQFSYQKQDLDKMPDEGLGIDSENDAGKSKDIINIALFGLGSRSKTINRGLTDSIMIVSIDRLHNKIKLTSVMRDSLVRIEGYRDQKINAAYALGGPVLAIKTLNQNFGLNIRDYATVNFLGMADIIDAMGGIEVELTERERRDANIHIRSAAKEVGTDYTLIEKAGKQILNGAQAVAFARIRHVSTAEGVSDDFGRTDRQRYVMEQIFNKALAMNATEYPKLIKTLLKYMETSLSYEDILSMAGVLAGGIQFEQSRVPLRDYVINAGYSVRGSSTVYYNLDYAKDILNAFIYDDIDPEVYMEQNGINKDRWHSGGDDYVNRPVTSATTAPPTNRPNNATTTAPSVGTTTTSETSDTGESTTATGETTEPTGEVTTTTGDNSSVTGTTVGTTPPDSTTVQTTPPTTSTTTSTVSQA